MRITLILFILSLVFAVPYSANAKEFMPEGKIIKAECLKKVSIDDMKQLTLSNDCLRDKVSPQSSKIEDEWKNESTGESYEYEYIGRWGSGYLVRDLFDGGGSMKQSSITVFNIVPKSGSLGILKKGVVITGGDRCMEGIISAKMQKGQLRYSVKINEYGLINIVDGDQAQNYKDLDGPNNCVGIANYVLNPKDGFKHLESIKLEDDFDSAAAGSEEFWPCLQYTAAEYIRKHGRMVPGGVAMDWSNNLRKSCPAAYEIDNQN